MPGAFRIFSPLGKDGGLLPVNLRAVLFVSGYCGILLTIMAVFVKILGERLHTAQLMFSRALIGFLIFTPLLIAKDGIDVIRTKHSVYFQRGFGEHAAIIVSFSGSRTWFSRVPWRCSFRGHCS